MYIPKVVKILYKNYKVEERRIYMKVMKSYLTDSIFGRKDFAQRGTSEQQKRQLFVMR